MATYSWTTGSAPFHKKQDAQKVGTRLATLERQHNSVLTPAIVVEDAKRPRSPLHPCFEWDDAAAASKYREVQAREVMRHLTVEVAVDEEPPQFIKAYVHLHDSDHDLDGYIPIGRVLSDAELYNQALERALGDLRAIERRYDAFRELRAVIRAARETIETTLDQQAETTV